MELQTEAAWWQRLLFGFGALIFVLLLTIVLFVIRDYRREPTYFRSDFITLSSDILETRNLNL
jgi:hypothetical protein